MQSKRNIKALGKVFETLISSRLCTTFLIQDMKMEKKMNENLKINFMFLFTLSPRGCVPAQSETRFKEGTFSKGCDNKTLSLGLLI